MAFSFSAAINNLVAGTAENVADVVTCFNDIKAVLNNGITGTDHMSATANIAGTQLSSTANILSSQLDATTVLDKAGVSSAVVRRGKSNIAAAGTRTSASGGALTNGPDQVASVVLPTDGLIAVAFQGTWQETVADSAHARIMVGGTQLKAPGSIGAPGPAVQSARTGSLGTVNRDIPIATAPVGLVSGIVDGTTPAGYANVTTGQPVYGGLTSGMAYDIGGLVGAGSAVQSQGGPCYIFAVAGTYTLAVEFWVASGGTVTVKDRHLWVWTLGF